jgi:glutamate formiminotransferase/formiminotetrahydrofolate cyclodeaminase
LPAPGGGSVAALAGALGAALAQMVAGLTAGRKKYVAVDAEMREIGLQAAGLVNTLSALVTRDAEAYGAVTAAYKLPSEPQDAANARQAAITDALLGAAEVPLETARACAKVAELAATCAVKGNTNAVSDAGVAALLADAACRGAVYNIRINVSSLEDKSRGAGLIEEASQLLAQTRRAVEQATGAVDKAIG